MKLIKLIEGLILFRVDFLKEGATLPQRLLTFDWKPFDVNQKYSSKWIKYPNLESVVKLEMSQQKYVIQKILKIF